MSMFVNKNFLPFSPLSSVDAKDPSNINRRIEIASKRALSYSPPQAANLFPLKGKALSEKESTRESDLKSKSEQEMKAIIRGLNRSFHSLEANSFKKFVYLLNKHEEQISMFQKQNISFFHQIEKNYVRFEHLFLSPRFKQQFVQLTEKLKLQKARKEFFQKHNIPFENEPEGEKVTQENSLSAEAKEMKRLIPEEDKTSPLDQAKEDKSVDEVPSVELSLHYLKMYQEGKYNRVMLEIDAFCKHTRTCKKAIFEKIIGVHVFQNQVLELKELLCILKKTDRQLFEEKLAESLIDECIESAKYYRDLEEQQRLFILNLCLPHLLQKLQQSINKYKKDKSENTESEFLCFTQSIKEFCSMAISSNDHKALKENTSYILLFTLDMPSAEETEILLKFSEVEDWKQFILCGVCPTYHNLENCESLILKEDNEETFQNHLKAYEPVLLSNINASKAFSDEELQCLGSLVHYQLQYEMSSENVERCILDPMKIKISSAQQPLSEEEVTRGNQVINIFQIGIPRIKSHKKQFRTQPLDKLVETITTRIYPPLYHEIAELEGLPPLRKGKSTEENTFSDIASKNSSQSGKEEVVGSTDSENTSSKGSSPKDSSPTSQSDNSNASRNQDPLSSLSNDITVVDSFSILGSTDSDETSSKGNQSQKSIKELPKEHINSQLKNQLERFLGAIPSIDRMCFW